MAKTTLTISLPPGLKERIEARLREILPAEEAAQSLSGYLARLAVMDIEQKLIPRGTSLKGNRWHAHPAAAGAAHRACKANAATSQAEGNASDFVPAPFVLSQFPAVASRRPSDSENRT